MSHGQARGRALRSSARPAFLVIGGRHDGARFEMSRGSCLVGSAVHGDAVLSDDAFDGEQFVLSTTPNGSFVRNVGHEADLDGRRLRTDQRTEVLADQALRIGEVTLLFGDEKSDWEVLRASARSHGEGRIDAHPIRRSLHRRPVAWAVTMTVLALGIFGAMAGAMTLRGTDPASLQGAALASHVRRQVERLDIRGVRIDEQGGQISVVGHVDDQRSVRRLRDALGSTQARLSLFNVAEIERYIDEWMGARGFRTEVTHEGDGRFVVRARARRGSGFEESVAALPSEVPGVRQVSAVLDEIAPEPVASQPEEKPDPLVIGGVNGINSGSATPYLSTGQHYIFKGGVLQNGGVIVSIDDERVVVDNALTRRKSEVTVR